MAMINEKKEMLQNWNLKVDLMQIWKSTYMFVLI